MLEFRGCFVVELDLELFGGKNPEIEFWNLIFHVPLSIHSMKLDFFSLSTVVLLGLSQVLFGLFLKLFLGFVET